MERTNESVGLAGEAPEGGEVVLPSIEDGADFLAPPDPDRSPAAITISSSFSPAAVAVPSDDDDDDDHNDSADGEVGRGAEQAPSFAADVCEVLRSTMDQLEVLLEDGRDDVQDEGEARQKAVWFLPALENVWRDFEKLVPAVEEAASSEGVAPPSEVPTGEGRRIPYDPVRDCTLPTSPATGPKVVPDPSSRFVATLDRPLQLEHLTAPFSLPADFPTNPRSLRRHLRNAREGLSLPPPPASPAPPVLPPVPLFPQPSTARRGAGARQPGDATPSPPRAAVSPLTPVRGSPSPSSPPPPPPPPQRLLSRPATAPLLGAGLPSLQSSSRPRVRPATSSPRCALPPLRLPPSLRSSRLRRPASAPAPAPAPSMTGEGVDHSSLSGRSSLPPGRRPPPPMDAGPPAKRRRSSPAAAPVAAAARPAPSLRSSSLPVAAPAVVSGRRRGGSF